MSFVGKLPPCVAAGHADTARTGAEVLAAGGTAADAAAAAILASCVSEAILTGLTGGGFVTYWDAAEQRVTCLDFFVAVPALYLDRPVSPMREIEVRFGPQRIEYYVGASTVAVPGVPAGLRELHRRWGSLPWRELVEPAVRLARKGVVIPPEQVRVLSDVREAMLIAEGADIYAPGGTLVRDGDRIVYPGLDKAMELLRDEGSSTFYAGTLAESLLDLMAERGGAITSGDLAAYDVIESHPAHADIGGCRIHARRDLLDLLATVSRLPAGIATMAPGDRYVSLVRALRHIPDLLPGTSSMVAVDAAGNACAAATSLGLGSGDWLPGFGIHCNSMLGEGELMHGSQQPGDRVPSMMVPLLALDDDGVAMAASAAGGSRIRSSLIQVLMGVLAEGLLPQDAIDRPRVNPVSDRVHAELGVSDEVVAALEADGHPVERWTRRAAYFGGVSAVSRDGAGADPRRGGAVAFPDGTLVRCSLME